jgi:hypothetical protein
MSALTTQEAQQALAKTAEKSSAEIVLDTIKGIDTMLADAGADDTLPCPLGCGAELGPNASHECDGPSNVVALRPRKGSTPRKSRARKDAETAKREQQSKARKADAKAPKPAPKPKAEKVVKPQPAPQPKDTRTAEQKHVDYWLRADARAAEALAGKPAAPTLKVSDGRHVVVAGAVACGIGTPKETLTDDLSKVSCTACRKALVAGGYVAERKGPAPKVESAEALEAKLADLDTRIRKLQAQQSELALRLKEVKTAAAVPAATA